VVIVLLPFLKYPANPPAVGDPETINSRTVLYLVMILVGLAATAAAIAASRMTRPTTGEPWTRWGVGAATFLAPVIAAWLLLPEIDEIPEGFPAALVWDFRIASLGTQFVFWAALGILFGLVTERAARRDRVPAVTPG
jgi:predicted cobalt transporter CbtA